MTDRLLVDLGADGRVSVSTLLDGEFLPTPAGEPFELVWPLDTDALEDLRWYLEDYLRAPFGVYGERGPQVEGRLTTWGQAVFTALFGNGPARDAYVRARAGSDVEIVFRSSVPARLGLPWELVCDPARPTPVALDRGRPLRPRVACRRGGGPAHPRINRTARSVPRPSLPRGTDRQRRHPGLDRL